MNINRNNYEEYFILYLDNELGVEDRHQVEAFAELHPDLKIELQLLLQTKTAPDEISFPGKQQLFRNAEQEKYEKNLEQFLLLYIDDELNTEERTGLESFLRHNQQAQADLALLTRTRLQPESIQFPDKQLLYRKEEKQRVIAMKWWRLAAAAVLLLGIVSAGNFYFNNNGNTGTGDPRVNDLATLPAEIKKEATIDGKKELPEKTIEKATESINPAKVVAQTETNTSNDFITSGQQKKNKEESNNAMLAKEKQTNNLPDTDANPYVRFSQEEMSVADVDIPAIKTLTTQPNVNAKMDVTQLSPQPLYTSNTSTESDEDVSQKGRKGGLRGFVRKITRTFEKNTNFEATDGDDRLLVAGLAIKL